MSGQAPVNRYTASYTVDGEQFTLGPIAGTRMAGPDDAMVAEAAYLTLLEAVTNFELNGSELALLAGERPCSSTPPATRSTMLWSPRRSSPTRWSGKTTAQAKKAAEDAGYAFRIIEVDGVPKAVTADLQPDRINVAIEDGVVTEATAG